MCQILDYQSPTLFFFSPTEPVQSVAGTPPTFSKRCPTNLLHRRVVVDPTPPPPCRICQSCREGFRPEKELASYWFKLHIQIQSLTIEIKSPRSWLADFKPQPSLVGWFEVCYADLRSAQFRPWERLWFDLLEEFKELIQFLPEWLI